MTQIPDDKKMTVAIGCDPNAAALKEIIKAQLNEMGYAVKDFGSDDPIYARVAFAVGEAVAAHHLTGVFCCAEPVLV